MAEEFLALPNDSVERWLIRGEPRENRRGDGERRTPDHAAAMFNVAGVIGGWLHDQPVPRGKAYAGGALCKLRRDNETLVGIDVAYVSKELRAATPKGSKVVSGVPILAVEILSPSDTHSDVTEKVQEYLDVGVAQVWVVDPDFETVSVYRPHAEPLSFNKKQELVGEPELPRFRVRVAELFE